MNLNEGLAQKMIELTEIAILKEERRQLTAGVQQLGALRRSKMKNEYAIYIGVLQLEIVDKKIKKIEKEKKTCQTQLFTH